MLLVYRPPCCLADSLLEPAAESPAMALECSQPIVLADLTIHVNAPKVSVAQECMASMTTMAPRLQVAASVHVAGTNFHCWAEGERPHGGGESAFSLVMDRSLASKG